MAKIGFIYANSLFLLAKEKNSLKVIYDDFKSIRDLLNKNNDLIRVLSSPVIEKVQKKDLIEGIFKDTSKEVINLIKVMIDKNRETFILDTFLEFEKLYNDELSLVFTDVETATDLSESQIEEIKAFIKNKYNREAIIRQVISKDLIMGLRIRVLGEEIDMSLKGSFDKLEQKLKNRIEVSG